MAVFPASPGKFYAAADTRRRWPFDGHGRPALARMLPRKPSGGYMELPLSLTAGHHGTLVASPEALGWDVRVDVDGVTVLRSHVRDWHRVERLRARVEATHDAATNPRQPAGHGAGAG